MARGSEADTARNIQLYRAALPRMRGKVVSVLWLLVISAVLLTGTTFTWITLSTSPEVTGVTTTMTANGAMEIALSDADGAEPDTSAAGDSSAAQAVTLANLTWGNLVNLSDSSYGIENIVLRPAVLNLYSLLTNPLQAVSYGADGRITTYTDSFAYTTYDPTSELAFVLSDTDSYGVRAVSFINYESAAANESFAALKEAAYTQLAAADYDYSAIVSNEDYISSLAGMMGPYVSQYAASFLGTSAGDGDCSAYIEDVYYMAADLQNAYEELGEAYAAIAKLQQAKADENANSADWTRPTLLAASEAELTAASISITDLDTYKEDYAALEGYVAQLYSYYVAYRDNGTKVYYDDLSEIINFMADVPSATINGMTIDDSGLMGYVIKNYNDLAVLINDGFLYRIEQRIQSGLMATDVEMKVTAGSYSLSPEVDVSTSAEGMTAWDDYSAASTGAMFTGTDPTPRETYALAVDLWVRTNVSGGYLTLQGDVVTDEETGEVVGYIGDNRVWADYELTSNGAATTQGMGSCFTFSVEDPLEALKMEQLLDAMTVAFVSEDGTLLAYADMDTENIWEDAGRYVVPVAVRGSGSNYIKVASEDGESEEIVYYITALEKNVAQRITVMLYLDGTRLTNEQAAAAQEIVGSLNLQFGSTEELTAADSEALYNQTISAQVTADQTELSYTGAAQTVTLTAQLTTDGAAPSSVTGYFLRQLSSTQGTRQETITFTQTGDGTWTGQAELTASGTYILNALTIDGVMYTLSDLGGENVTVTVSGYSVSAVSGEYASGADIFEVGNTATADVTVTVASTVLDSLDGVDSVQAVFLSESGTVASATLALQSGNSRSSDRSSAVYSGTVRFSSSGVYTLTYIYVDGQAYTLADDLQYTLNITLGLSAHVWISTDEELADGESATYFMLPEEGYVTLDVFVSLTDDNGDEMTADDIGSDTLTIKYKADTGYELDATLPYDSANGYFAGQVQVWGSGVYSFQSLTAASGTIANISSAPSITALAYAAAVTEYYADSTAASQVILTSSAYLSVDLTNATELSVAATVTDDTTGETYEDITGALSTSYVTGDGQSVYTYVFELPTAAKDAPLDATWSRTSLTLTA
ncbi:MAG: hypothetical protein LIO42_01655 [Oscillospiraceae bacterium]|nr:hypothetical protein [Oscillospiraceae bacterium]